MLYVKTFHIKSQKLKLSRHAVNNSQKGLAQKDVNFNEKVPFPFQKTL